MTLIEAISWTLRVGAASAFILAGTGKLRGHPFLIEIFRKVGVGQWLRYVTGAIEVGSGLALLYPPIAAFGAFLLFCTMAVALIVDVRVVHINPTPGLVLLVSSGAILWIHHSTLTDLAHRFI